MMRLKQKIKLAVCALGVCAGLAASAATIGYVADGNQPDSAYCNRGYGIEVNVSVPSTGYTVEYAESETGPWSAEPVTYVDVCTEKPVWFRISAAGFDTVVDSRPVTIVPKALTGDYVWVEQDEEYVYDGTAKLPTPKAEDTGALITAGDYDVVYEDNVNAGTARAVFTGKRNYTGSVEVEFEIAKAENAWTTPPAVADWTYGRTASEPVSAAKDGAAVVTWSMGAKPTLPGRYTATFTVPESRNYNELTATVPFTIHPATIVYVADGNPPDSTYCNRGFGIEVNVSVPSTGYTVEYAESETGPWSAEPVTYVDVCTAKPVWFRISAAGYGTVVDSRLVTILPRDIAEAEVWAEQDEEYVYDGTAKRPTPKAVDTGALITADDYDVAYEDNVNAGTARVVFTGKRNYTGTAVYEFEIRKRRLTLTSGDGSWTHDGAAHTETTVTVGGDGFAPGEGATYGNFATLTDADSVPNSFDYTLDAGTLAGNYEITKVYGTLTVTPPPVTVYEESDAETIFKWEATGAETAKIVGFKDPNQEIANVVIPDKIEGHFITAIAPDAFANSASGMTEVAFPIFCTRIGDRAFYNVTSLASITFSDVRRWDAPGTPATLSIGRYAFSSCLGLRELTVGESVGQIDDYAFLNCRKLAKIMILGKPSVGRQVFRSAGMDATPQGVEVLIDPALASDTDYMAALKGGIPSVTVKGDAVVSSLKTQAVSLEPGRVTMTLSVRKASSWGEVNPASVKVRYWKTLSEPAEVLAPTAAMDNGDGTLTVEIAAPEGGSGFFQPVME